MRGQEGRGRRPSRMGKTDAKTTARLRGFSLGGCQYLLCRFRHLGRNRWRRAGAQNRHVCKSAEKRAACVPKSRKDPIGKRHVAAGLPDHRHFRWRGEGCRRTPRTAVRVHADFCGGLAKALPVGLENRLRVRRRVRRLSFVSSPHGLVERSGISRRVRKSRCAACTGGTQILCGSVRALQRRSAVRRDTSAPPPHPRWLTRVAANRHGRP